MRLIVFIGAIGSLSFLLYLGLDKPKDNCIAVGLKQPICGTHRPEDLVKVPNQPLMIVSEMGDPTDHHIAGSLSLLNLDSKEFTRLFPLDNKETAMSGTLGLREQSAVWGDPTCSKEPPTLLAPHGVNLSERASGHLQLLVVNHGSREAVEYFQLKLNQDQSPALIWRGCVNPKPATFLNNVVAMSGGGFIATQTFDQQALSIGALNIELIKGFLGWDTGYVFEWYPDSGFMKIAGSDGRFVNGIAISPDESSIFATYYMGDEVRKIDRVNGKVLATATVAQPDNLTWTEDGSLLVASHQGSLIEKLLCLKVTEGPCIFKFGVYELNPETLDSREVLNHKGMPFGAATVAKQVGDHLYLGSYAGDRIMQVPYVR